MFLFGHCHTLKLVILILLNVIKNAIEIRLKRAIVTFKVPTNIKISMQMNHQDYSFRIDEKSIASDVADRIYYEFLLARYMPEVLDIEKGSVTPIKTEDFKQQLISRINLMVK